MNVERDERDEVGECGEDIVRGEGDIEDGDDAWFETEGDEFGEMGNEGGDCVRAGYVKGAYGDVGDEGEGRGGEKTGDEGIAVGETETGDVRGVQKGVEGGGVARGAHGENLERGYVRREERGAEMRVRFEAQSDVVRQRDDDGAEKGRRRLRKRESRGRQVCVRNVRDGQVRYAVEEVVGEKVEVEHCGGFDLARWRNEHGTRRSMHVASTLHKYSDGRRGEGVDSWTRVRCALHHVSWGELLCGLLSPHARDSC